MLPSDQSRMIEQAKFTYSVPGKLLKRQIKAMETKKKNKLKI